jgi:hypothetical protein
MNVAPKPAAPSQQQSRVENGKNHAPRNPPNPRCRLNHMNVEQVQEATDVVLGMLLVNSVHARVLFDSGASHSFVMETFACKSGLQPIPLKKLMLVQIPGSITKARWTRVAVPIEIHGIKFLASVIGLGTKGLEVVLGTDWISQHQGVIDCAKKTRWTRLAVPIEIHWMSQHQGVIDCAKKTRLCSKGSPSASMKNHIISRDIYI